MGARLAPRALALAAMFACACDRERPARADGQLLVFPGSVDFRRVAVYGRHSADVDLQNVGRATLTVKQVWVEAPSGPYAAEMEPASPVELRSSDRAGLHVRFAPLEPGTEAATLVIATDALERPLIRVPLSGIGVDARAELSSDALDFGRIEAQSTKLKSLTVQNISDLPIQVALNLGGEDRDEFAAPSLELQPFEQRVVDVAFAPQRVGKKSVKLQVSPCAGCPERPVSVAAEALDRAIIAQPWNVDFGQVPIDRGADAGTILRNISTEPMTVEAMTLDPSTDPGFTVAQRPMPRTLQPGEALPLDFQFSPGHMGASEGSVSFQLHSVRNPRLAVPLHAWGGAAEVCLSPTSYDFGTLPVGAKETLWVLVKNCGSIDALEVREVTWGGDGISGEDQFNAAPSTLPQTLQPGEQMAVKMFFEPTRAGDAGGYLHIGTSLYGGRFRVALNGRARVSASCSIAITPPALDYGTVVPGFGAVLGLKVSSLGTDVCAVKNIHIVDSGGGAFFMPGGVIDGVTLWPADAFAFMVAFTAPQPAPSAATVGSLKVESADPANPTFLVPLTANSAPSCLVAAPRFLDFGVTRPDCPSFARRVSVSNACAAPLQISSAQIGAGTTDGEFVLSAAPALPLTLAPGGSASLEVSYLAQVAGLNLSPLFVAAQGLPAPYLIPLIGESTLTSEQVDTFTQQEAAKVDVLFVVDNTASMIEEQPKLQRAIPAFVDAAMARAINLHVGVTTTGVESANAACPGGAAGGEGGRLFPADGSFPRVLTQATPGLTAALQRNVRVGLCAFVERGLEAMRLALSDPLVSAADDVRTPLPNDGNLGFLRDEAALAVVFVTDEDDHSPDDVATYVQFLRSKKGVGQPQRGVIYAIAPTQDRCGTAGGVGTRYSDAAIQTGGEVLSPCASDYAPLLQSVADRTFSPQDRFPLSGVPMSGSVVVTVNGTAVGSGVRYDAVANQVIFNVAPAAGSRIAVTYRRACP